MCVRVNLFECMISAYIKRKLTRNMKSIKEETGEKMRRREERKKKKKRKRKKNKEKARLKSNFKK